MGRIVFVFTAVCMMVSMAFATEQPIIINTGEASVLTNPGIVEFKFYRGFKGETFEDAMAQCNTFIKAAPQAIRGSELQPTEIICTPPVIVNYLEKQVDAFVTVRFSMAVFNTANTGPVQFAALCDKLIALAKTMNCACAAPVFIASDPEITMTEAVARATENAYPPAEAVAISVKTNIYAVDRVDVISIEWEQRPEGQTAEVPQIACNAKVQVTYALAPQ